MSKFITQIGHYAIGACAIGAVSGLAAVGTIPGNTALGVITGIASVLIGGGIAVSAGIKTPTS